MTPTDQAERNHNILDTCRKLGMMVEITGSGTPHCGPCAAVREKRYYTPDEAPALPIKGCEADRCRCTYFWSPPEWLP
jgi:hypothetical protein